MSENKNSINLTPSVFISSILIIGSIANLILVAEYYNYNKKMHPKVQDCISIDDKEDYETMEKVNLKKEEKEKEKSIFRGKPEHGNQTMTTNIILSSILLIIGILFAVSAILITRGKDFGNFLHKGKSQKIIFIIIGLFLLSTGITYGVLIGKYKQDKYEKDRVSAVCFRLEELNSVEDIDKKFQITQDIEEEQPTAGMQINTIFSILYSLGGLILVVIGARSTRKLRRRKRIDAQPNIVINLGNQQMPAQISEPNNAEPEASSKIFAPAY